MPDKEPWQDRIDEEFRKAKERQEEPEKDDGKTDDRDAELEELVLAVQQPAPGGDMAADAAEVRKNNSALYRENRERKTGMPAYEIRQEDEKSSELTKSPDDPSNDPFRSHDAPVTEENYPPLAKELEPDHDHDRT